MKTQKERQDYHRDVSYEVWRNGGNMDNVSYDRVLNAYYDGIDIESTVTSELRHQRPQRQQEKEYQEQECPEQQYEE